MYSSIWKGYLANFIDNNYINRKQNNKTESYTYTNFNGGLEKGDYCDLLNKIIEFTELYSKGIKLKFYKNSLKIPQKKRNY